MVLLQVALFTVSLVSGFALNLLPAALFQPQSNSTGIPFQQVEQATQESNLTSATTLSRLDEPQVTVHCDGPRLGQDLNSNSCIGALRRLNMSQEDKIWGKRDTGQNIIGLPQMSISCKRPDLQYGLVKTYHFHTSLTIPTEADGTCSIEPWLLPGKSLAIGSHLQVALGAAGVLTRCVDGDPGHVGGSARNLSELQCSVKLIVL